MADVRTFRAKTMQEALDLVRRELGPEAVILHTREVPQPRFLRWRRVEERVEVTAGTDVNVRPTRVQAKTVKPVKAATTFKEAIQDDGVTLEIGKDAKAIAEKSADSSPVRSGGDLSHLIQAIQQPGSIPTNEISGQLKSIEQMVRSLSQSAEARRGDEVPSELFHLYAELIDGEVEDGLAKELVCRLKADYAEEDLRDVERAKSLLTSMVQDELHCSGPISVTPGERKVVALVGPTGVGKTTTIAKLAANFRLRDGIRMGLVTVDTYRIAAVEQLRTYAEIIDLPMKVVTSPLEMRNAMEELSGLDLVLIDTAGRSPRDELKIQELQNFLAEAKVDEVHLVMSLVASVRSLEATASQFAVAGVSSLILTKLDEATGMGSLLSVARKIGTPVSYVTTGQDVPDDIEPAEAERIARLILGSESLFAKR